MARRGADRQLQRRDDGRVPHAGDFHGYRYRTDHLDLCQQHAMLRPLMRSRLAFGLAALLLAAGSPSLGQTPRPGGWLNLRLREDLPQGFAIHESPTISTMWPAMPCFSNLVLFDPMKPTHSAATIIGELAERWAWQDSYRKLVFFLRRDVTWRDGRPFSATDVKLTFDLLL